MYTFWAQNLWKGNPERWDHFSARNRLAWQKFNLGLKSPSSPKNKVV